MYDDRNRYDRQKPRDSFERERENFVAGSRDRYENSNDSFAMQNSKRFRSEQQQKPRSAKGLFNNVRNESSNSSRRQDSSNVVIYSPSTFDDVQNLIDYLKRREQVIVDFSGIDQTAVYRIMDFMSGAIYALNGSIQQITKNIFLFAPAGVTITVPPQFNGKR
ncbi:MAG: cell division protein SepF [Clostridia bacterium]|nr:cell division protein SepF [Clostridia bacterium]